MSHYYETKKIRGLLIARKQIEIRRLQKEIRRLKALQRREDEQAGIKTGTQSKGRAA